jgi:hypothetical protein
VVMVVGVFVFVVFVVSHVGFSLWFFVMIVHCAEAVRVMAASGQATTHRPQA